MEEKYNMLKRITNANRKDRTFKPSANDLYCGRPSKWGNEFRGKDRNKNIELHKEMFLNSRKHLKDLHELADKRLLCFCKPLPCHTDIYVIVYNDMLLFESGGTNISYVYVVKQGEEYFVVYGSTDRGYKAINKDGNKVILVADIINLFKDTYRAIEVVNKTFETRIGKFDLEGNRV